MRPSTAARCRPSTTSCTKRRERIEQALPTGEVEVLCHNDLLPANVLLAADRHWLIDFEYAGMNVALFDLANLSVNCAFDETDRSPAAQLPTTATRRIGASPCSG